MIRTTWREHRLLLAIVVGGLLALAVGIGIAVLLLADYRATHGTTPRYASEQCREAACYAGAFLAGLPGPTSLLPILVGAPIGAAVIARPIESGQHVLAFTQSRTRWSWFAARILIVFVPITAATTVLGAVLMLGPGDSLRFRGDQFASTFPVLGSHMLLGLMLGAAIALLLPRGVASTFLAVPAAVAAMFLATMILLGIRPDLVEPVRTEYPLSAAWHGVPISVASEGHAAWRIATGVEDSGGRPIADPGKRCAQGNTFQYTPEDEREGFVFSAAELADCLRGLGATTYAVHEHPDTHFWPMQWRETGLALLASALLLVIARTRLARI
ncbi:hypothetical protein HT102_02735 [Hoyosella sp. G463]|uniref:ABC transporter permease n=1 Tax=Lolliginicoccus lacisalsi TaxID=2742202 RepID=A0A927JA66_9ACTN|nr:hypothetical protein [Lolliginicoccus lacisalsi]MBD8505405.1 hypothetical protein [Lolliginicoccus lacisalsi]